MTSGDWGSSWSKPTLLHGSGLTDKPSVTADPRHAGTAYVVWSDYRDTSPPGTESDELLSITNEEDAPGALPERFSDTGSEPAQKTDRSWSTREAAVCIC